MVNNYLEYSDINSNNNSNNNILTYKPYVNAPNENNPLNFGNIPSKPFGCASSQYGGYRYKKSKSKSKSKYKSKKYNKASGTKKSKKKSKNIKKSKAKKKSKSKRQKGGSNSFFPDSVYRLNNIPYSQGYNINYNNSLGGKLANPIPINTYAKCPPLIKF